MQLRISIETCKGTYIPRTMGTQLPMKYEQARLLTTMNISHCNPQWNKQTYSWEDESGWVPSLSPSLSHPPAARPLFDAIHCRAPSPPSENVARLGSATTHVAALRIPKLDRVVSRMMQALNKKLVRKHCFWTNIRSQNQHTEARFQAH